MGLLSELKWYLKGLNVVPGICMVRTQMLGIISLIIIISVFTENVYFSISYLCHWVIWAKRELGESWELVTFSWETFWINHSYIHSLCIYFWALAICEVLCYTSLGSIVVSKMHIVPALLKLIILSGKNSNV